MEELIDIYNEARQPTGKVVPRAEAQLAAGEYVLYVLGVIQDMQGNYLIVQRSPDKRWAPLSWEVPGGGVRAGETSVEAVVREMQEEVGLDVSAQLEAPFFSYTNEDPGGGDNYFVDMYKFVVDANACTVELQVEEAIDYAFVPWEEICTLAGQDKFLHFSRLRSALGL